MGERLDDMLEQASRGDLEAAEWLGRKASVERDLELAMASARARGLGSSWLAAQTAGQALRAVLDGSPRSASLLERARFQLEVAPGGPRPAQDLLDAGHAFLGLACALTERALDAAHAEMLEVLLEQASRELWGVLSARGDYAVAACAIRLLETARSAKSLSEPQ